MGGFLLASSPIDVGRPENSDHSEQVARLSIILDTGLLAPFHLTDYVLFVSGSATMFCIIFF